MSEQDYGGGAGYAKRQDPDTVPSSEKRNEELSWYRERRPLMPAGRAIDEWDLAQLLDGGNETSHARIMRARLCAWAAPQLKSLILLDARELEVLEREVKGLQPDGKPYRVGTRVQRAQVPEWPRTAGD